LFSFLTLRPNNEILSTFLSPTEALLLSQYILFIFLPLYQHNIGMWLRNGYLLAHLKNLYTVPLFWYGFGAFFFFFTLLLFYYYYYIIIIYLFFPFKPHHRYIDADLFFLQCCVGVLGWDLFLCLFLSIFQLDFFFLPPWFWLQYSHDGVEKGFYFLFLFFLFFYFFIFFFVCVCVGTLINK
jgi:hypothetical protein